MIKAVKREQAQRDVFSFQGFRHGLKTSVPPNMLKPTELSECTNYRIDKNGTLIDRAAVIVYTDTAMTGDPVSMAYAVVNGAPRDIIGANDYKIYYLDSLTPTLIGTAEGIPYLIPFNDVCLICDGSYLKYIDGVSSIKIAYDAGTDGVQFDNYVGSDDVGLAVGNGTNTRVGIKFTSASWTAGYKIPTTQIDCKLKKISSPTGTISAKLRLVSDDSILATKDLNQDAADISATGEFVSFVFSSGDITTEMSPGIEYYATIEFSDGDASNYIELRCTSTTGSAYYYAGSYTLDSAKQPIIKVQPGTPPKCSFGTVSNLRPWLAGDPDNKGYVWYGDKTHLDFSTSNGGGYVSAVDENNNTFEVGAIQDLLDELFIYGTEKEPYIAKLTGSQPSEYAFPRTFQRAWGTQRTLMNVKNDLWNGSADGVDSLSGVQEYGDFRSFSLTDSVSNRVEDNWNSSTAFAGYYPKHAQYFLHMPTSGKTLVGHIKNKIIEDGKTVYPWTEYDLPVTPTGFGQLSAGFIIGADDGYLYQFSPSALKDLATTYVAPAYTTANIEFPNKDIIIEQLQFMASAFGGASFKLDFYIDGNDSDYALQISMNISMSDGLLVSEATGLLSEATGLVSSSISPPRLEGLNIPCYSIKLRAHTLNKVSTNEVYFNGLFFKYKYLKV